MCPPLYNDIQRMRQLSNESPLTFSARLQARQAKILAAINEQNMTSKENQAQIDQIGSMALNNLLTGLKYKLNQLTTNCHINNKTLTNRNTTPEI